MPRKWTTAAIGLFFVFYPNGLPAGQRLSEKSNYEVRYLEAPFVIDLVAELEPR